MSEENRYVACVRVCDARDWIEGSEQRRCSRCDAAVWISPAGQRAADAGSTVVCIICAAQLALEHGGAVTTYVPGTAEEVRAHRLKQRRN